MPEVARKNDEIKTGHACDAESSIKGHAETVYAENVEVARDTDEIFEHLFPDGDACVPHETYINEGSGSVFAEHLPIARVGDSADAGHISGHADTVFAG